MAKRSRGLRSCTRKKFSRTRRDRGLSPITRSLQHFETGTRVNIVIDPSYHRGQPHARFHGLTGRISGQQGQAYLVQVKVGNMDKRLIVAPQHLRPQRF